MNYLELKTFKDKIKNEINLLNSKTVCFTGHRPQKLPWRFNEYDSRCIKMKETLKNLIENSIKNDYDTFICGMALGFDIICAETILELKKIYPHIILIGALPCKNQDCKWLPKDKIRYQNILSQVDKVRCIYDTYNGSECMLERNRYMVNNSSLMIALFDGKAGGTKSTINYAKKQGVEVIILEP